MAGKFKVLTVERDPANANIVATVEIWDDAAPARVFTRKLWAFDLDDARIAAQVANIYSTLATRETNLPSIAKSVVLDVPAPAAAQTALAEAQKAFAAAWEEAEVRRRADPALDAAYADLVAARDAAK
jgi:hypothetical protein